VAWKPISGVTRYRIQYSTSSTMSNAVYKRFSAPYAELTGLASSRTYYIKVRAITDAGNNLSAYSSAIAVTTRSSTSYPWLAPTGLRASSLTTSGFTASWTPRATGLRYRIRWAKKGSTSYTYKRLTTNSVTLTGLASGTAYQYSVRVIDADGNALSSYTPIAYTSTAFTYAAPSSPRKISSSRNAIALAWTAAGGAPGYQVQVSRKSSFASPTYLRTTTTYAEITGLAASTTYYLRVRATTSTGVAASSWSASISVATRSSNSYLYLAPAGLMGKATGTSTIATTWKARGTSPQYRVRWAKKGTTTYAYARVVGTSFTITKLSAATAYTIDVRAITKDGASLSEYSPAVGVTTAASQSPLRVASFNVRSYNTSTLMPGELRWEQRRDTVIAQIKAQAPDVLGAQEASQAWLRDQTTGALINKSQFEDLVERLGSPYRVSDPDRNNCEKSTTPTNCVYQDQGASKGTKIIYNATRLTMTASGSKLLGKDPSGMERYLAWAIFRQNSTGKSFFFADTHLTPDSDLDGTLTLYDIRVQQMRTALAEVRAKNTAKLPVVFVGDLNSTKWRAPSNAPYDLAVSYGLVDPLGNAYRTTSTAPGATVEKRILTNVDSYNGFRLAATWRTYINGSYLDYIMTSPMRVSEWQTVANLDADHNNIGIIASDHYMVRATLYLP